MLKDVSSAEISALLTGLADVPPVLVGLRAKPALSARLGNLTFLTLPEYFATPSGDGLLIQFHTNTLWSYNPDAKRWTKLAYFDPAHGVFVVLEGTTVWAYRYR